jgi:hypothetical protein
MTFVKGRDMLVNKDGDPLLGEVSCTVDADHGEIAIKTKGMDGTAYIHDGQECTVKVDGAINDSDTVTKAFLAALEAETDLTDVEVVTGFGTYSATWFVGPISLTGASGSEQTFSFTLKASGGYTFTPVEP